MTLDPGTRGRRRRGALLLGTALLMVIGAQSTRAAPSGNTVQFQTSAAVVPADRRPSSRGDTGYKLLVLEGGYVKWGPAKLGTPAVVTYALVEHVRTFEQARNCQAIAPIGSLLQSSRLTSEQFTRELRLALADWERAAGIVFRPSIDADAADILIGAQTLPRGRAFANVALAGDARRATTAKGLRQPRMLHGRTFHNSPLVNGSGWEGKMHASRAVGKIAKSLVCLNPEHIWKLGFGGDPDVYDLRYTLTHEIGHSIGLDHAGPRGQLMSFRYNEDFRQLQPGDVAGARELYGPPRRQNEFSDR